jgi:cell division protein FtsB
MWRIWLIFGGLVWATIIAASGAVNYMAGYQFGRSPEESRVFALIGVSADAWKAVGPIFVVTLWRGQRRLASCLASIVWIACFAFAVFAALGLAAENRSAMTGARESVTHSYQHVRKELSELERQRLRIGAIKSAPEIQGAIDAMFARGIEGRGTVALLSNNCRKDTWRTRVGCEEIAKLRQELATASEAQRLDEHIGKLNDQAKQLRDRGGLLLSDPQAQLIARLSLGYIAPGDVALGVVILLVIMVELISAFAPVVLSETSAAYRAKGQRLSTVCDHTQGYRLPRSSKKSHPPAGDLFEYLSAQVRPDKKGSVPAQLLFDGYRTWCSVYGFTELKKKRFFEAFDQIIKNEMGGHVRRHGRKYIGLRLLASESRTDLTRC